MNVKFLLTISVLAGLTSCSTVYKSGQTPDDVYYSPVKTYQADEENKQKDENRDQVRNDQAAEDREIRMRTRDRRWRNMDNDNGYNYNHNCNCYCNQYGYGYYNHPYYNPSPYYIPNPKVVNPVNSSPRMINLGGYGNNNNNTVSVNPKTGQTTIFNNGNTRRYNNTNRSTGLGAVIRQVFTPRSDNNSSNNNNTNTNTNTNSNPRTYQPAAPSGGSSSGSSSGGSSGGGGVTRPPRGGK